MIRIFFIGLILFFAGCREPRPVVSPPGYDLANPKKVTVGEVLHEISGIVFLNGNPDTVYAIEDEAGKLFHFHLGDGKYPYWKFGKHGDYEDVAILNSRDFIVLRSDGSLFVAAPGAEEARAYEHILPKGEYEGLYADGDSLIALCKSCPEDDQQDEVSAYVVRGDGRNELAVAKHFVVGVGEHKKKDKFRPSALARHPLTHEWYVLSSVNKELLVLDGQWKLKASYALDPILFKQPEGLAFDKEGNMYVSNEGHGGNANVLVFSYAVK